ncbi:MAG: peptidylprolyl isomerase [Clostridia bacterium]|nr:peptidylprolyl isomerase [Clostridia bacterium]
MSKKYKTHVQRQKQKKRILILCAALLVLIAGGLILSRVLSRDAVKENPVVTVTMEDGKQIVLELYPDKAPNTVANFVELASSGYYDGLIFHRVIENFMIQGGDPTGTGSGGPGYAIMGEFSQNGFSKNDIPHERGVISMARSNAYDSAGSQFFIVHQDSPHLNGGYAAFGRVLEGMDTVDAIASVPTNPANDRPLTPQVIRSIRVDTKGETYKAEKIR